MQPVDNEPHFVTQEKPHVQRHLIVAAARRMELSAGGPDQLRQAPLDIHVNIFVGLRELELTAVDLALNRLEAADDLARIAGWNNALFREHFRVRDTAHNVMAVKPRIDLDRRGKSFDGVRRACRKASAPKLGLF